MQLSGLGEGMIRQHTQTRAELFSVLASHLLLFLSAIRKTTSEVYICFLSGSASEGSCHKVTGIMVVLGQNLG